ncbi:MAG TPA: carbohydrate porin [Thermoanaerobaculia bacterium]|nr:carbohydrate porin [Thermoanaerobaculia bacterium]
MRFRLAPWAALALLLASYPAFGQEDQHVPPRPTDVILIDSLGHAVGVAPEQLPKGLRPPPEVGIERQVPRPAPGRRLPSTLFDRMESGRERGFTLFPAVPPRLEPYLAAQDEFGNTAFKPGPLIDSSPLEPFVQGAKYWLGARGVRYVTDQTFTYTGVPDTPSGAPNLGYYTFKGFAKWALYADPLAGTAGWLSNELEVKAGLGAAGATQNAKSNIGMLTQPQGTISSHNGFRVPELAWQQAFDRGAVVVVGGVVDQGNYLDVNTYANTGRGQFLNSALINSMVLPLPAYNFGVNFQWQPASELYALVGATAGDAGAGQAPWTNFSWQNWSITTELGFAPHDFLDLGPGVYRVQPFLAQAGGPTQGGIAFNFEQQLGHKSPFGWFGRFGVGGSQVSAEASTQVGTGFVMEGPLEHLGLVPKLTNDYAGVAFVWSQPSATSKTVYHRNEYVAETFYTLQVTPMMRLQPDLQIVWNPAFNPDPGPFTIVQTQIILSW